MTTLDNERILFLWPNINEYFAKHAATRRVCVDQIFQSNSFLTRLLRKIHFILRFPFISFWLGKWKNELAKFDIVIIHESKSIPPVVKYINKKYSDIRVIVWYWNPVKRTVSPSRFNGLQVELVSFDENDCTQFGLRYCSQYYFNDIYLAEDKLDYDVYFLGADKGRMGNLMELKQQWETIGLKCNFHVTERGATEFRRYRKLYRNGLSYDENLQNIASSKAILDYVSEHQSGMTLRPLEAIFLKKKLITNDSSIVNKPFYCKGNIFIIGNDTSDSLLSFINSPYIEIPNPLIHYYDFNEWLERITITGFSD